MVRLYREKIDQIFSDVSPNHKFWLVTGGEVKNLMELELALDEMDDKTFLHHVDDKKNDFAGWIKEVIKDDELADTLEKLKTKESTQKAIKLRVNSLQNLKSIHEAIDNVKDKITQKQAEVEEDKVKIEEKLKEEEKATEHAPLPESNDELSLESEKPSPEKEDFNIPKEDSPSTETPEKKGFLSDLFGHPGLYIGMLLGFLIGYAVAYFL